MYLIETFFRYLPTENTQQPTYWLNQIIEQWRYNGQILGREIPLYFAEQENVQGFGVRVVCPEQHSLLPEYQNQNVTKALADAEKCGLFLDSFQIIADDLNSDVSCENEKPSWQVLYTTYVQSCSPLHSGEDFSPIPLYKQLKNIPHLSMDIIKWQENWQACDQLQMNGAGLEQQALAEISTIDSSLSKHGRYLAQEIEQQTGIPTYYYLYRVGGESLEAEQQRCCPHCGKAWALDTPLFDLFSFKCDDCRLISNLSWHWQ
ncbi:Zn-ribbon-containing protein [Pasteurella sp. PK-2025]|uniref:Zn-ribbon-containing protein n=1 Tax=Pasteurella sp. PK-2025 TaxID=3413133 RepID=UPI003C73FEB9